VTKALEIARRNKEIGNALDADLVIYADGASYELLKAVEAELPNYLIVSGVKLVSGVDSAPAGSYRAEELPIAVVVTPSSAEKCERCWIHAELTSVSNDEPGLFARCAGVMAETQG